MALNGPDLSHITWKLERSKWQALRVRSFFIEIARDFLCSRIFCVPMVCTAIKARKRRSPWETVGNFRNAYNSEGSHITCPLSDTTEVYHRQRIRIGGLT
jgi:hypothetical protein